MNDNFDDDKYRMFSKSDKTVKDKFLSVPGAEVLLTFVGWKLITTDEQDGGLYVYQEDNERGFLEAVIKLLTMYVDYLKGKMPEPPVQNNDDPEVKEQDDSKMQVEVNDNSHNKNQNNDDDLPIVDNENDDENKMMKKNW